MRRFVIHGVRGLRQVRFGEKVAKKLYLETVGLPTVECQPFERNLALLPRWDGPTAHAILRLRAAKHCFASGSNSSGRDRQHLPMRRVLTKVDGFDPKRLTCRSICFNHLGDPGGSASSPRLPGLCDRLLPAESSSSTAST